MNAQDKAKQLVDKMYSIVDTRGLSMMSEDNAKQCALICANEMIDVLWHTHINPDEFNYWQEVKTEIEKL